MANRHRRRDIDEPELGKTIAKAAVALLFFAISFTEPTESDPVTYLILCYSVAAVLLAWALLPWLRYWRAEREDRREAERVRQEEERLRAEEENAPRVCPGCGATSRGRVCEYCGTKLK